MPVCILFFQEELILEHLSYWRPGCFREEIVCHFMFSVYEKQNQIYTDSKSFYTEDLWESYVSHISQIR